jgi:hypothetical protein
VAVRIWRSSQASDYEIAQTLDRSWACDDQLSTACYFADESTEADINVAAQRVLAERAVDGRDARTALALRIPVAVWCSAALLFAVVALVGVRYSVSPQLALTSPLPPLLFPEWAGSRDGDLAAAALVVEQANRDAESARRSLTQEQLAEAMEAAAPIRLESDPLASAGEDPSSAVPEVEGLDPLADTGDQLSFEDPSTSEQQSSASEDGSPDERGSNLERQAESQKPEDGDGEWGQQSNSLLDRLKEALKQLSEGKDPEDSQSAQQESNAQQDDSNAEASPGASEEGAAEAGNGQGAPSEAAMESDAAQPETPQQSAQGGGETSGSGTEGEGQSAGAAGDGEGSKQIEERLAQQTAFEVLEEFYLRRSEELSGDVLVETTMGEGSSAATPYRSQQGTHGGNSGLALRDQAPPAYRTFVENYFRQLRSKKE